MVAGTNTYPMKRKEVDVVEIAADSTMQQIKPGSNAASDVDISSGSQAVKMSSPCKVTVDEGLDALPQTCCNMSYLTARCGRHTLQLHAHHTIK
jgi:hypothetical protein